MNGRVVILLVATGAGWFALLVAALASGSTPLVAVLAGLAGLGVWHRHGQAAALAPVLGCVALLASGTSMSAAGAAGVLVLVHVVAVDLAGDAPGASIDAVVDAVRPLVPGAALGAGAAVVVGVSAWAGTGAPTAVVLAALLAAPMLVLSAVLLALGTSTRGVVWSRLVSRRDLSEVTKRYLARARADSDDLSP